MSNNSAQKNTVSMRKFLEGLLRVVVEWKSFGEHNEFVGGKILIL